MRLPLSVSPSRLKTRQLCPRKEFYQYGLGLRAEGIKKGATIGSLVHTFTETVRAMKSYKMAFELVEQDLEKLRKRAVASDWESDIIAYADVAAKSRAMIHAYAEYYGDDDEWNCPDVESWIQVPNWPVKGIRFNGRLDAVVEIARRGLALTETKTGTRLDPNRWSLTPFEVAAVMYAYAYKTMFGKAPFGVLWDWVRTPSIRVKADEGIDEFSARLQADMLKRPLEYFSREIVPFGPKDIELGEWEQREAAMDLITDYQLYVRGPDVGLFHRRSENCLRYGACEYLQLCVQPITPEMLEEFDRRERSHGK